MATVTPFNEEAYTPSFVLRDATEHVDQMKSCVVLAVQKDGQVRVYDSHGSLLSDLCTLLKVFDIFVTSKFTLQGEPDGSADDNEPA